MSESNQRRGSKSKRRRSPRQDSAGTESPRRRADQTTQQLEQRVLEFLREQGSQGSTTEEIEADFGSLADASSENESSVEDLLQVLVDRGEVVRVKGSWVDVASSPYRRGTYRRVRRKMGEVELDVREGVRQRVRRLSIQERDRGGARAGDIVLVRRIMGKQGAAPHPLGAVVRVVERQREQIVGWVDAGDGAGRNKTPVLRSFDVGLRHDARDLVFKGRKLEKCVDKWVVVDVLEESRGKGKSKAKGLVGRISEVLGRNGEPGVDVEVLLRHHQIPREFSDEVSTEATRAAGEEILERPQVGPPRSSFVQHPTVTIDGASAKDFDDAITLLPRAGGGFRLLVHIADVAHYVQMGSVVDLEARKRGTSVYFPERVVPMLPPVLSDDVCSLRPDELRYAMTVEMGFDDRGRLRQKKFYNSTIRSDLRLTYAQVADWLEDPSQMDEGLDSQIAEMLVRAGELARLLSRQRRERGALEFRRGGSEQVILGDDLDVLRREKATSVSHRLIEEFMLATNETVAKALAAEQRRLSSDETAASPAVHLYRYHPQPDHHELAETWSQLLPDEEPLPVKDGPGATLNSVAQRCSALGLENLAEQLLLRSLMRAEYTVSSRGHFALALEHYCHFTSPIRRYPDLVMHRRLKEYIARRRARRRRADPPRPRGEAGFSTHAARRLARDLSQAEQRAEKAERDLRKWRVVRYLAREMQMANARGSVRKGKRRRADARAEGRPMELAGVVTGALDFGLFVQLESFGVDALLPVDALHDDWYELSKSGLEMVGRSSGRRIGLGDRLELRLKEVDETRRRINVELADSES